MYLDRRVIPMAVAEANGKINFFDGKLENSHFCACAVKKYAQNSLIVVKSPTF